MKITIENTSVITQLVVNGIDVPARIWQGETDSGVPVHVFITRIAPEIPKDDPRQEQFIKELKEQAAPRPTVVTIPLRMIL